MSSAPRIVYVVSEQGGYVPVLAPGDPNAAPVPAAPRIVWRTLGGGDARTWAEVMALLGTNPNVEIYIDEPVTEDTNYQVPAGTYNMRAAFFSSPGNSEYEVKLLAGSVLQNLRGVRNVVIETEAEADAPNLTWPGNPLPGSSFFFIDGTGEEAGLTAGTVNPGIVVPDGEELLIQMTGFCALSGLVKLGVASQLFVTVVAAQNGNCIADNSVTSVDAGSQIQIFQDGTLSAMPTFGAFAGTVTNQALGRIAGQGEDLPVSPNPGTLFWLIDVNAGHNAVLVYYDNIQGTFQAFPRSLNFAIDEGTIAAGLSTHVLNLGTEIVDTSTFVQATFQTTGGKKFFAISAIVTGDHQVTVVVLNLEVGTPGGGPYQLNLMWQAGTGAYG